MIKYNKISLSLDSEINNYGIISANLPNKSFTGICKLSNTLFISEEEGIIYKVLNIDSNPVYDATYIMLSDQQLSENTQLSIVDSSYYSASSNSAYKINIKGITLKQAIIQGVTVNSFVFLTNRTILENELNITLYELFEIDSTLQTITFISRLSEPINKITFYLNNNLYLINNENKLRRYSMTSKKFSLKIDINFASNINLLFYNANDLRLYLIDDTHLYCLENTFGLVSITDLVFPNSVNNPQGILIDNDYLYVISVNNSNNKLFKLIITSEEKDIKYIYYIKRLIRWVRYGSKLIWSLIAGCFGSGIWISSELWNDTDIWINNNT